MLVDSNILVYSINKSSPKHKKAQKFLQENINQIVIAHQNIFETLRVLTYKKFPSPMTSLSAIEAVTRITKFVKIISPDYKTHHITLEYIKKYKISSNHIFDAYLAATAISNNVKMIATDNNKDFKFFDIKVINPFN